jgi:hypothetical protein
MSFFKTQRLVLLLLVVFAVNGFFFSLIHQKLSAISSNRSLMKPFMAPATSTPVKPKVKKEPKTSSTKASKAKPPADVDAPPKKRRTKKAAAILSSEEASKMVEEQVSSLSIEMITDVAPLMEIVAAQTMIATSEIIEQMNVAVTEVALTAVSEPVIPDSPLLIEAVNQVVEVAPVMEMVATEISIDTATAVVENVVQMKEEVAPVIEIVPIETVTAHLPAEIAEISLMTVSEAVKDAPVIVEAVHEDDVVQVAAFAVPTIVDFEATPVMEMVATETVDVASTEISSNQAVVFEAEQEVAAKIQEIDSFAEAEIPSNPSSSSAPSRFRYAPFMKAVTSYFTRAQPVASPSMEDVASETISVASTSVRMVTIEVNDMPVAVVSEKPSVEPSRYRYAPFMKKVASYFTRAQPLATPAPTPAVQVTNSLSETNAPASVHMKKYAPWQKEWRQL